VIYYQIFEHNFLAVKQLINYTINFVLHFGLFIFYRIIEKKKKYKSIKKYLIKIFKKKFKINN